MIFALATLASSFAFAHGTTATQAANAVTAATRLFGTQPKEIQRQFIAISATQTGHEQFAVVIALRDGAEVKYACWENEEVEPVVWECK